MASHEIPQDFVTKLSHAVTDWGNSHLESNSKYKMQFIHDGKQVEITPEEYAKEISSQTELGKGRVRYYWEMSNNRIQLFKASGAYKGEEYTVGEEIIDGYANLAREQRSKASKPVKRVGDD